MKIVFSSLIKTSLVLFFSSLAFSNFDYHKPAIAQNSRINELNLYWQELARTAKEGDLDGMQALYHEDAVLVKPDTTIYITDAFKYRWKKEILEVRDGKRNNTLAFKFSRRVGNDITAFEKGIYHYTSIENSTGKVLGDSYIHFETLLVKVNNSWVATMEFQQGEAEIEEWNALK